MLTPEARASIEAQEIFRQEVRDSLQAKQAKPPGRWQRLANFLERPIILWLLSTVVVGAITFFYDQSVKRRTSEAGRLERIRDLDIEISTRLRTLSLLSRAGSSEQNGQMKNMLLLWVSDLGPIAAMTQSDSKQTSAKRSLPSLLWELEALVPAREKEDIAQALLLAETINQISADNLDSMPGLDEKDFNLNIAHLAARMSALKRWSSLEIGGQPFSTRLRAFQKEFFAEQEAAREAKEAEHEKEQEAQKNIDAVKEVEQRRIAAEAGALVALRSFAWGRREDFRSNFLAVEIENKSGRTITKLSGRAYARSPDGRWIATREFNFSGSLEPERVSRLEQRLEYIEEKIRFPEMPPEEIQHLVVSFYPYAITYSDGTRINYDTANFGFLYKRDP